jgi:hypothetical protein
MCLSVDKVFFWSGELLEREDPRSYE